MRLIVDIERVLIKSAISTALGLYLPRQVHLVELKLFARDFRRDDLLV